MKQNYEIVSLGVSCLPKLYCTRNFLKKTKKMGELSLPFDLAGSPSTAVNHFLKTDFADYFDGLSYSETLDYTGWVNQLNCCYNHDKDCGKNDREKFVTRFQKRIENFRKVVNDEKFIFFIVAGYHETSESINALYDTIEKVRGTKPFKLLFFDMSLEADKNLLNKDIAFKVSPYNSNEVPDWNAWENKSDKVIELETSFVDFVKEEISKLYKVEYFKPKFFDYDNISMHYWRKFIQGVFSVSNESKTVKRVNILGFKIKFKRYLKIAKLSSKNK